MDVLKKLVTRFKEPSTWAGLGAAAMLYGVNQAQFDMWVAAVSGIALFLSVILGETKE